MYTRLHVKYPLFFSDFNFLARFSKKNTQTRNLTITRSVGVELFHADRRTDTTKMIVNFRNFANAPNIGLSHSILRLNTTFALQNISDSHFNVQWKSKM